jgi:hypothetical protein
MPSKGKKILLVATLLIFILIDLFGLFFTNNIAKATGAPVVVTESVPAKTQDIKMSVGAAITNSALGAVMSGAEYFIRRLAYDTAVAAAGAATGNDVAIFQEGFGTYLGKTAADMGADILNTFAMDALGLNLCAPANLNIQLSITLGLRSLYPPDPSGKGGPTPSCTWDQFEKGVGSHADLLQNKDGALSKSFSTNFSVDNSDFGIAMGAINRLDNTKAAAQVGAQLERLEGQGYKAVTGLISGNVKTPSQLVRKEVESVGRSSQGEMTSSQIAGIYATKSASILPMAIGTFVNTFVSQALNNVLTKGLFPDKPSEDDIEQSQSALSSEYGYNPIDYVKATQKAFAQLITKTPIRELSTFNAVSQFASCEAGSIGVNNCVIDRNLQRLIEIAKGGEPLTLIEAIEDGFLDGELPLISPYRKVDNEDIESCYLEGYCYSNIQKLVKARVLPLGFEVAALKADPDRPEKWKLIDVIKGFNDCPSDSGSGQITQNRDFPYCHLIDPKWIVKAPEIRCAAKVYTNALIEGTGERLPECVDWQSCVLENEKGECSKYGYCTKEENIWRFGGNSCNEYYSTCRTFVSPDGLASYLTKTIDYGQCDDSSVGCQAYVTEKDNDGWVSSLDPLGDNYKKVGRNQTVFFNQNLASYSKCSKDEDGCSAFYKAVVDESDNYINNYSIDNLTYIKKAPGYLGCYDTDTSDPEINWPVVRSDLLDLPQDESCQNYSQVCLVEEVGCEMYTPVGVSGAPSVPGIIGGNYCEPECVGYDTYKQEKTDFSNSVYPLYIIPGEADECFSDYRGCTEFVNLEAATRGGEGLEYYTKFAKCEKTNIDNQETFYTWEGSAKEGYILRSHKLATITSDDNTTIDQLGSIYSHSATVVRAEFSLDSPVYGDMSGVELETKYEACNQERYNIMINSPSRVESADPDCRAFYNRAGDVYYRILAATVIVSPECHSLRRSRAEFYVDNNLSNKQSQCERIGGKYDTGSDECQRCYGGGKYSEGYCIYQAITAKSEVCSAASNGCRAYIGNNGYNTKIVGKNNSFEPIGLDNEDLVAAREDWGPASDIVISAESPHVGLHSLRVNLSSGNELVKTISADVLNNSEWYEVSFWAKGSSQNFDIYLRQGGTENHFTVDNVSNLDVKVTIGDLWKKYDLGPIKFTGDGSQTVELVFARSAADSSISPGIYYIDNVLIQGLQDTYYRIAGTWKTAQGFDVPLACDDNPSDAYPGEALGCQEYKDSDVESVYLTAFDRLCREEAVGCTPMFDTFNTLNTVETSVYSLWCEGGSTACTFVLGGEEVGSCSVPRGETGCYMDEVIIPNGYDIDDLLSQNASTTISTVVIPADTPSTTPIYLTNDSDSRCPESSVGCMEVGQEERVLSTNNTQNYVYTDTHILNNPKNYEDSLCREDLVGCERFSSGRDTFVFKDPVKTGNKICFYKPQNEASSNQHGWFMKDVGYCHSGVDETSERITPDIECITGDECGEGNSCKDLGSVPCYDDYLQIGGEYGIRSNSTDEYNGLVGMCDRDSHNCTEFVDPSDPSDKYPGGKPYYIINDSQITQNIDDCIAGASQKEGCVLFDQTDNPNKIYDSVETYDESERNDYGQVAPVPTENNNANILLKVRRDRVCGEWLACKTGFAITGEDNKTDQICYQLGRCSATIPNQECTVWEDDSEGVLDESVYINRDISWTGQEYSGYSLYNKYQISDLDFVVREDENENKHIYLVHSESEISCKNASNWTKECGVGNRKGVCVDGDCVYTINGIKKWEGESLVLEDADNYLNISECKAPPEADSPFPLVVVGGTASEGRDVVLENHSGFDNANYCQDEYDCTCNYQKVIYKGGIYTDYFDIDNKVNWPGIVHTGYINEVPLIDIPYNEGDLCPDKQDFFYNPEYAGYCSKVEKKENHRGTYGFCLEQDFSRPLPGVGGGYECLTWLPLDIAGEEVDIYNNDSGTGYDLSLDTSGGGAVYCTEASGKGQGTYRSDVYNNKLTVWEYTVVPPVEPFGAFADWKKSNDYMAERFYNEDFPYGFYYFNEIDDNFNKTTEYKQEEFRRKSPFYLLNILPNSGGIEDYMDKLHTLMYNFVWKLADDASLNYTMLYIKNPIRWFNYAHAIDLTLADEGQLDENFAGTGYSLTAPIYERQIEMIRFAPFVFPGYFSAQYAQSSSHPKEAINVRSSYISSDVKIDFEKFRNGTASGCNMNNYVTDGGTFSEDVFGCYRYKLEDVYIDDHHEGNVIMGQTPYVYLFRGEMRSDDPAVPQTKKGDIRYMMFVTLEGNEMGTNGDHETDDDNPYYFANLVGFYLDPKGQHNCDNHSDDCFWRDNNSNNIESSYKFARIFLDFNKDTGELINQGNLQWRVRGTWGFGNDYEAPYKDILVADGWDYNFNLAAAVKLKPTCKELVSVVDEDGKNKAWTDRTWNESKWWDLDSSKNNTWGDFNSLFEGLYVGTNLNPAGSTGYDSVLFDINNSSWPLIYDANTNNNIIKGRPMTCSKLFFESEDDVKYVFSGLTNDACTGYSHFGGAWSENANTATGGRAKLKYLFAEFYDVRTQIGNTSDSFVEPSNPDYDKADSLSNYDWPPQIYSLNPKTCFDSVLGESDNTLCTVGDSNSITVNRQTGVTKDYDYDGVVDYTERTQDNIQVGIGHFRATTNFFAWAHHNRMPIVKVMVDWSDGFIQNENIEGKYKNRKPYCGADVRECYVRNAHQAPLSKTNAKPSSHNLGLGLTCLTSGSGQANNKYDCPEWSSGVLNFCGTAKETRFGNSDRACKEGYFTFSHNYSCDLSQYNPADSSNKYFVKVADLGPEERDAVSSLGVVNSQKVVCRFKPRVQIRDNWGYCNASQNPLVGDYSPQANGGYLGSSTLDCDLNSNAPEVWTYYHGNIIVVPSD